MKKRSPWLIFTLVAIAQFMVVLDVSITNVALPTIKHDFLLSTSALQWIITAYILCFGGFLLLGGRAADLFGRRKTLLIGMSAFTTLSLLIGLSQSPTVLVVLRALQGLSAALMSPAALSIVLVTFKEGLERNKALGYWALVATGGAAVGVLLGGLLTQYLGWQWNFFINVPIGVMMVTLISKLVPVHEQEETKKSLDIVGAMLVTASLMLLVLAFSQAPQWGWLNASTLSALGAAIVLLLGFLYNESRVKAPLIPLDIFKVRNVVGANMIMVPLYANILGIFFLTTLYLQNTLHFSPVQTGLAFLPFPVVLGYMSTRIPGLVAKFGYRRFLIAGPLLVAVSLLWMARLPVSGSYLTDLLPTLLLMPLGMGITIMPTIAAATRGVQPHQAGLASGLVSTSQQMGGALGLAILSGVAATAAASAGHVSAQAAAVHGYHVAFLVDAGFMLVAAAIATLVIKEQKTPHLIAQPAEL